VQALEQYLDLLWQQFQYDWAVFSTPWVYYTIVPWLFYFIIFLIKWYVLLVPITLPCTVLSGHFKHDKKSKELDISSKICNN
jgi:hypothetical protein